MVVLAATVGWKVAVLYVIAGLTVGIVGGLAIEFFKLEKWVEEYVWKIRMGETAIQQAQTSFEARIDYGDGGWRSGGADRCRGAWLLAEGGVW